MRMMTKEDVEDSISIDLEQVIARVVSLLRTLLILFMTSYRAVMNDKCLLSKGDHPTLVYYRSFDYSTDDHFSFV